MPTNPEKLQPAGLRLVYVNPHDWGTAEPDKPHAERVNDTAVKFIYDGETIGYLVLRSIR